MKRLVDLVKKGVDLGRWGYKIIRMGKILILGCFFFCKKNNNFKIIIMFKILLYLLLVLYI